MTPPREGCSRKVVWAPIRTPLYARASEHDTLHPLCVRHPGITAKTLVISGAVAARKQLDAAGVEPLDGVYWRIRETDAQAGALGSVERASLAQGAAPDLDAVVPRGLGKSRADGGS